MKTAPLVKHLPIYVAAIGFSYFVAWTAAFVFINGPQFTFYFDYLGYFWIDGGGERPFLTGLLSIALSVPLSLTAVWLTWRRFKTTNERTA